MVPGRNPIISPIYRREPLLTLALISIGFPKLLFGPELDSFWYDDVLSSGRFSGRSAPVFVDFKEFNA